MSTLRELEDKDLLYFLTPIDKFQDFLKTLPLKQASGIGYRPTRQLTPNEKARIGEEFYGLTELGQRAFSLIIEAVSQQLQKPVQSGEGE